jgi:hypothetical protein
MKRTIFIILLSFFTAALFAQTHDLEYFTLLYNSTETAGKKLDVLRQAQNENLSGIAAFYAQILKNINLSQPNFRTTADKTAADDSVILIAGVLGNEQYAASGPDLWMAVRVFSNPLVKADALIAMGKTGAAQFVPEVCQLLRDLNNVVPSDRQTQIDNERIAYGAILCLENYRNPAGYIPVFFASTGWYSARIRNQASISLSQIMSDPSEPLLSIIRDPGNAYMVKHMALRTGERAGISDGSKAVLAAASLSEGWLHATNDPQENIELAGMRKLALNMIRRYGTDDVSVYPNINLSYTRNFDIDEKLGAVQTLSALGTDEAARLLIASLQDRHNKRLINNWTSLDEQMIRAIIPALGNTRKSAARPSLTRIVDSPTAYTNTLLNLAYRALNNLPK